MTTKKPPSFYLPLWEAASAEEIGLHISCVPDDQAKLANALFACRKEMGGFDDLILIQPEPRGTIYLARKTVELPE